MSIELILRDKSQIDKFNREFIEDVQQCYSKGIGMPLHQPWLNLPEYIQKVYMPAFYTTFVIKFSAKVR